MTGFSVEIKKCPNCGGSIDDRYLKRTGIVFRRWTDGKTNHGEINLSGFNPDYSAYLVKCPWCAIQVNFAKLPLFFADMGFGENTDNIDNSKPYALLTFDDLYGVLESGQISADEEIYVRRAAWWAGNDPRRIPKDLHKTQLIELRISEFYDFLRLGFYDISDSKPFAKRSISKLPKSMSLFLNPDCELDQELDLELDQIKEFDEIESYKSQIIILRKELSSITKLNDDLRRNQKDKQLTQDQIDNLNVLYSMLDHDRLSQAEIKRELGLFDEAEDHIYKFDKEERSIPAHLDVMYTKYRDFLLELITKKDSVVHPNPPSYS